MAFAPFERVLNLEPIAIAVALTDRKIPPLDSVAVAEDEVPD